MLGYFFVFTTLEFVKWKKKKSRIISMFCVYLFINIHNNIFFKHLPPFISHNPIRGICALTWSPHHWVRGVQAPCLNYFFGGVTNIQNVKLLPIGTFWICGTTDNQRCRRQRWPAAIIFDTNLLATHAPTYVHVRACDLEAVVHTGKLDPSLMRMFLWTWLWPG